MKKYFPKLVVKTIGSSLTVNTDFVSKVARGRYRIMLAKRIYNYNTPIFFNIKNFH